MNERCFKEIKTFGFKISIQTVWKLQLMFLQQFHSPTFGKTKQK
jgi:hypothetical protein